MSEIKINIWTKISLACFIIATIVFAWIIVVGSPYWWISTITYAIAAVLSWGNVVYTLWKIHNQMREVKNDGKKGE